MSPALRKLLLWLVMLAIPLHGIASVAMTAQHWAGQGSMQMQEGAAPGNSGLAATAATVKQSATDCADLTMVCGHSHLKGLAKCNLSAPCGLVAAAAPAIATFLDRSASPAPFGLPSHERIAFCTGAPERPPRFSA